MTLFEIAIQFVFWSYLVLMLVLSVIGIHGFTMILMSRLLPQRLDKNPPMLPELPKVLIQIPVFNEGSVVERVIDSAAGLDYPRELLTIQVLDDSTDPEALKLSEARCAHWQAEGIDIQVVRRPDRTGYKAGALQYGLERDHAPYVAVFDADFIIPADFLRRSMGHFADPKVGIVQWRWDHLNENDSWLTRAQAAMLDGHFLVEEVARARAGWWCIFHGTAGIWRRACIDDAGGWSADTLAEDKDLSLRAYFKGWRMSYMDHVGCLAELPPTPAAFFSQQYRWTKGNIEVAMKLGSQVTQNNLSLTKMLEIAWRLYAPIAYLAVAPVLILAPVLMLILRGGIEIPKWWVYAVVACWVGSLGFAFVAVAGRLARGRSWWSGFRVLPSLMLIGPSLAVSNTVAIMQALAGKRSPFVRTPKFGEQSKIKSKTWNRQWFGLCVPETLMAVWLMVGSVLAWDDSGFMIFSAMLILSALGCIWGARGRRTPLPVG